MDVVEAHPKEVTDLNLPHLTLVVDLPPISPAISGESDTQHLSPTQEVSDVSTSEIESGSKSSLAVENLASCWANKRKSKEEKIWVFAQQIGVSGPEQGAVYVKKIQ